MVRVARGLTQIKSRTDRDNPHKSGVATGCGGAIRGTRSGVEEPGQGRPSPRTGAKGVWLIVVEVHNSAGRIGLDQRQPRLAILLDVGAEFVSDLDQLVQVALELRALSFESLEPGEVRLATSLECVGTCAGAGHVGPPFPTLSPGRLALVHTAARDVDGTLTPRGARFKLRFESPFAQSRYERRFTNRGDNRYRPLSLMRARARTDVPPAPARVRHASLTLPTLELPR